MYRTMLNQNYTQSMTHLPCLQRTCSFVWLDHHTNTLKPAPAAPQQPAPKGRTPFPSPWQKQRRHYSAMLQWTCSSTSCSQRAVLTAPIAPRQQNAAPGFPPRSTEPAKRCLPPAFIASRWGKRGQIWLTALQPK